MGWGLVSQKSDDGNRQSNINRLDRHPTEPYLRRKLSRREMLGPNKAQMKQKSRKLFVSEILYRCFLQLATVSGVRQCIFGSLVSARGSASSPCTKHCWKLVHFSSNYLRPSPAPQCGVALLSSLLLPWCFVHLFTSESCAQRTLQIFICLVCVAFLLEEEERKT